MLKTVQAQSLPNLRILACRLQKRTTSKEIKIFLEKCPNLCKFSISGSGRSFFPEMIAHPIFLNLRSVTTLSLLTVILSKPCLESMSELKSLTTLKIKDVVIHHRHEMIFIDLLKKTPVRNLDFAYFSLSFPSLFTIVETIQLDWFYCEIPAASSDVTMLIDRCSGNSKLKSFHIVGYDRSDGGLKTSEAVRV